MDPDAIRAAVHDLFKKGDETIIDYVCGILEDEHFEFGDDGEGAFESIGPFLVRAMWAAWPHVRSSGCCMVTAFYCMHKLHFQIKFHAGWPPAD